MAIFMDPFAIENRLSLMPLVSESAEEFTLKLLDADNYGVIFYSLFYGILNIYTWIAYGGLDDLLNGNVQQSLSAVLNSLTTSTRNKLRGSGRVRVSTFYTNLMSALQGIGAFFLWAFSIATADAW